MLLTVSNGKSEPVVLVDFDNTIVRGDASLAFVWDLLWHEPARFPATFVCASAVWWGILHPWTITPAISAMLWTATWGLERGELDARQRAFVARRLARSPWLFADARRTIEAQRARGARVVVVTGCEEKLARLICETFRLGDLEIVGSRIERRLGGWIFSDHCHHAKKLGCLARHGVTPPWALAFSDSARDLPILRNALRATLVNPSPRTALLVKAALGERVAIAHWA